MNTNRYNRALVLLDLLMEELTRNMSANTRAQGELNQVLMDLENLKIRIETRVQDPDKAAIGLGLIRDRLTALSNQLGRKA